jgi:DNA-directed RNA polymerase beta subunit
MEDAMIINKASLDRGFAHGTLIKSETVDLTEKRGAKVRPASACACRRSST